MKIAIASDHGGYELKQILIEHLNSKNIMVLDLGCNSSKDKVDYPDFAKSAALKVAYGEVDYSIMIDGAGVGSTMVANKVNNVRAALCNDLYCANNSKEHNNANMLVMGSMVVGPGLAKQITDVFIEVKYAGGRHDARVNKINALDSERGGIMNRETLKSIISDIVMRISKKDSSAVNIAGGEGISGSEFNGKLLTEEYLRINNIKRLKISKNTIILPLAQDYINSNKIEILR